MENTETTVKIMLNPNEDTTKSTDKVMHDSVGVTSNTESRDQEDILNMSEDSGEYEDCCQEATTSTIRCSERKPKPKNYEDFVTYICTTKSTETELDSDPLTVTEALSRADKDMWKQAMKEEIRSFEKNNAWELVSAPADGTIVECKWVFKRKIDNEDNVRYRARLVAKGFRNRE